MAQFPLTTSAVRISQTLTQGGAIQNTGAQTVYLGNDSSVSPLNYGLSVSPGASVQWESGAELWACADAPGSTVNVLYGARAVTVSEMNAVVTGDVTATIDNASLDVQVQGTVPVDIQNAVINADVTGNIVVDSGTINVGNEVKILGGGQGLYFSTHTGDSGTWDIPVGIIAYPSYKIKISTTINHNNDIYLHEIRMNSRAVCTVYTMDIDGANPRVGHPSSVTFDIPNVYTNALTAFEIHSTRILSFGGTASRQFDVVGMSTSVPAPQGDTAALLSDDGAETTVAFINGSAFCYLPPSVSAYGVRIAASNTAPNYNLIHLQCYQNFVGWVPAQSYVDRDQSGNKLVANGWRTLTVPGSGMMYRLGLNAGATFAGQVMINISERLY